MKRKLVVLLMVCAMLSACSGQTAQTAAGVENSSSTESSSIESSSSESEASPDTEKAYAVERIDLATNSFDGFVGDAVVITPAVYPTMVKDAVLTYSSTDESVVVVSEDGSGTLTGVGSAEIVVTDTASGVEARFAVTSQAVPQTSKPVANTQQQQPGGNAQQQQGSQSQSGSQQQQGTGNAQQGGTQQQQPSGGTQNNTGNTGGSIGGDSLPQGGYITDEEAKKAEQDTLGMTADEFYGLTGDEANKIYADADWAY